MQFFSGICIFSSKRGTFCISLAGRACEVASPPLAGAGGWNVGFRIKRGMTPVIARQRGKSGRRGAEKPFLMVEPNAPRLPDFLLFRVATSSFRT